MTVVIRPADRHDAAALAALAASAFRVTYKALLDDATIEAVVAQTCTVEAFAELADSHAPDRLLVAEEHQVLHGFLDFAREPDGLELRRLYVRPGQTSKGVGAALLGALEDSLPVGTTYRIVVVEQNVRGVAFWERHGFCIQDRIDGLEHFASHRNVEFHPDSGPAPLLVLHRTKGD